MKNKLFGILINGFLAFGITGCGSSSILTSNEKFGIGTTLDDGRHISFTFDVPYNDGYLSEALLYNEISIDDFIDKLYFVSDLNDGGSKLYKYNSSAQTFGAREFYVLICDSYDGIKDIFVARNTKSLTNKCVIKIDDLEGVSMSIKSGTLTKEGATIVIKDTSSRNNMYGEEYRIDKKVNEKWQALDTIIDDYAWISIGYKIDEDNKLELKVNWKWLYGELEKGEYRIVKSTSESGEGTSHYITAEFEIE